jgi:Polysulphide reductase, NrfD
MTEQLQVPPAEFSSYYGRPILKVTRWREPHLPAYLFLGEMSGALAFVAAAAHGTGRPRLARAARLGSAASAYAGAAFLTAELGRPERFLHMLRVAKPTSPMSMGSWILSSHSGLVSAAAASEVTGLLPGLGAVAGAASAVTGAALATYPGVLLADTAVPAWHMAYREIPVLFAGGAMTAASAVGLAASAASADRGDFDAVHRLAVVGAALEGAAGYWLEKRPGLEFEPYRTGAGGQMLVTARYLTLGGGVAALAAGRSRVAAAASAALLAAGSYCAKAGMLRAGVASAKDPKYVVASQRGEAAVSPSAPPAPAERDRAEASWADALRADRGEPDDRLHLEPAEIRGGQPVSARRRGPEPGDRGERAGQRPAAGRKAGERRRGIWRLARRDVA